MKEYGWIRVDCANFGAFITMEKLDYKSLQNLIHGLYGVYENEYSNDENEKYIESKLFNIEIKDPYRSFHHVSFHEISSGDILKRGQRDSDNFLHDIKRMQPATPGGYQYKDIGG